MSSKKKKKNLLSTEEIEEIVEKVLARRNPPPADRASGESQDSSRPKDLSSRIFIDILVAEVRAGWSITPLTGAGVSVRSGLMVGRDFSVYLTWVIYKCIEDRHDLRSNGWPEPPSESQTKALTSWVSSEFVTLCKAQGVKIITDPNKGIIELHLSESVQVASQHWMRPLTPKILNAGKELKKSDEEIKNLFATVKQREPYFKPPSHPEQSPYSLEAVKEAAIHAMHDWRAMLNFLSKITIRFVNKSPHLKLEEAAQSVVDSFNQHITRGRKPNMTHSMLAHLAAPLRTRILFTTNFDSLHEEAFNQLGLFPERLSVSVAQGLPSVDTVRSRNCIVKLHGTYTGTRADFSLDEMPSKEELGKFFHCVVGKPPSDSKEQETNFDHQKNFWNPSHLLVIGNALSDARLVQFIKYVLEYSHNAKVFLVGFNQIDYVNFERIFYNYINPPNERVFITITDRSDLLLLELYQALTLTLPKGGFSYHYSHDVPPYIWRSDRDHPQLSKLSKDCIDKIVKTLNDNTNSIKGTKLILTPVSLYIPNTNPLNQVNVDKINKYAYSKTETAIIKLNNSKFIITEKVSRNKLKKLGINNDQIYVSGMTNVIRETFRRLTNYYFKQVVWLELEDYTDTLALAHQILHIIALRRGKFQLEHAVLISNRITQNSNFDNIENFRKELETQIKHTVNYLGGNLSEYVISIYGRNGPGCCSGWDGKHWEIDEYERMHVLLDIFAICGAKIIYLPLSIIRKNDISEKVKKLCNIESYKDPNYQFLSELIPKIKNCDYDLFANFSRLNYQLIAIAPDNGRIRTSNQQGKTSGEQHTLGITEGIKQLVDDLEGSPDNKVKIHKQRFLYATSLFRASRPPSVFFTAPIFESPFDEMKSEADNDWIRSQIARKWLIELRDKYGIVWRKPGGNSWLYRDGQVGLRLRMQHSTKLNWRWPETDSENVQGNEPIYNNPKFLLSKFHAQIARWYFRAFCTTNHGIPLLEAMYHYYQSILHIKLAEPDVPLSKAIIESEKIIEYRKMLCMRLMTEWLHVIRIGCPTMDFWYDPVALDGWFGDKAIKLFESTLTKTFKKIVDNDKDLWRKNIKNNFLVPILEEFSFFRTDSNNKNEAVSGRIFTRVNPRSHDITIPKLDIFSDEFPTFKNPELELPEELKRFDKVILFNEINKLSHRDLREELLNLRPKVINKPNRALWVDVSRLLHQRTYEHFQRAKRLDFMCLLEEGSLEKTVIRSKPSGATSRATWKQVIVLSKLCVDVCGMCPPSYTEFEMSLRVEVIALHAVALGRLGRFFQAHCRLNEAHALLTRIPKKTDQSDFAVLELRRAEIRVLEAEHINHLYKYFYLNNSDYEKFSFEPSCDKEVFDELDNLFKEKKDFDPETLFKLDPKILLAWQYYDIYFSEHSNNKNTSDYSYDNDEHLKQVLVSKMDDAWSSIEAAEHLLSGQIRTSIWWARLCSLRLRFFAMHERHVTKNCGLLAMRRKQDLQANLKKWLRLGIANVNTNEFRKTRLIWYFIKAKENWCKIHGQKKYLDVSELEIITSVRTDDEDADPYQRKFIGASPSSSLDTLWRDYFGQFTQHDRKEPGNEIS